MSLFFSLLKPNCQSPIAQSPNPSTRSSPSTDLLLPDLPHQTRDVEEEEKGKRVLRLPGTATGTGTATARTTVPPVPPSIIESKTAPSNSCPHYPLPINCYYRSGGFSCISVSACVALVRQKRAFPARLPLRANLCCCCRLLCPTVLRTSCPSGQVLGLLALAEPNLGWVGSCSSISSSALLPLAAPPLWKVCGFPSLKTSSITRRGARSPHNSSSSSSSPAPRRASSSSSSSPPSFNPPHKAAELSPSSLSSSSSRSPLGLVHLVSFASLALVLVSSCVPSPRPLSPPMKWRMKAKNANVMAEWPASPVLRLLTSSPSSRLSSSSLRMRLSDQRQPRGSTLQPPTPLRPTSLLESAKSLTPS